MTLMDKSLIITVVLLVAFQATTIAAYKQTLPAGEIETPSVSPTVPPETTEAPATVPPTPPATTLPPPPPPPAAPAL